MSDLTSNLKGARDSDLTDRYLSFELNNENYAIPLLQVKEVIEMTETTPIPNSPEYLKGIINLRGAVITVIDLRLKMSMPKVDPQTKTTIIILDLGDNSNFGVIVDKLNSVRAFAQENIDSITTLKKEFLGVAKDCDQLTVLLDIHKVLNIPVQNQLQQVA